MEEFQVEYEKVQREFADSMLEWSREEPEDEDLH